MGTELTKYQPVSMTISDVRTLATDFARSGYFTDARELSQAVVKIQAGVELGFGPVYSMTKIYIVKGRVMVGSEVMGAMVKRSGRYDYTVKSLTDKEVVLDFTDNGKVVYTAKFTMDDAKTAGLLKEDSGWLKWPREMLMSKAVSHGARIVCPHIIAGVYSPADFGVPVGDDGEPVVEVESTAREITDNAPEATGEVQPKEHWCAIHNTKFFKTEKMKSYAHPIKDSKEWCHEHANKETPAAVAPPPANPPATPQDGQETREKAKRDVSLIKNFGDLYTACKEDWGMTRKDVWNECGVNSQEAISDTPAVCYQKIAAVRPVEKKGE